MANEARKPKNITADEADTIMYPRKNHLVKTIVDQGRWTTTFEYVFEDSEGLWAFCMERGSTECQEVDQPEVYECYPMKSVPSITYEKE